MFRQRKDMFRLCLMALLVGCFGCSSQDKGENFGTEEEQHYDAMQLNGQWADIVSEADDTPVQSPACYKLVCLARYRLGLAGADAIQECLSEPKKALTSVTGAMMMSDVYIQLGFANLAQRAAFEAMVTTKDEKTITRALQRLTEIAVVTGQYALAKKYVTVLKEKGVNRKWLETFKAMSEHPELINDNPVFKRLKEQYENTEDQFFM